MAVKVYLRFVFLNVVSSLHLGFWSWISVLDFGLGFWSWILVLDFGMNARPDHQVNVVYSSW